MSTFTISQTKASANLIIYPGNDLSGCSDWTPIGDTPNYKCVNENTNVPDEDTTYVYWDNAALGIDMYELLDTSSITGVIQYVQIFARAKSNIHPQYPDATFKLVCSPTAACGALFKSDSKNLTTRYQTMNKVWLKNPHTDATWTPANINDLAIGIEASSPTSGFTPAINNEEADAAGDFHPTYPQCSTESGAGSPSNYTHINTDNDSTYIIGLRNVWTVDTYNFTESDDTYPSNYINKVVITARCKGNPTIVANAALVINGAFRNKGEVDYKHLTDSWVNYTWTFETNLKTGGRWTVTDMLNLQFGIYLFSGGQCSRCKMDIYHGYDSPEIRVTQVYAIVNYVPPTDDCTLNKPEEISSSHSRNTQMLNFWDGTREVYDLKRSHKGMVLTGSEYCTNPYERIAYIRAMGKNGSTITISGLSFNLYNGDYKIKSFGWKHMHQKPDHYEWILELENTT